MWKYNGTKRPPMAIDPEPGQESVWDYPRPPRLDKTDRLVLVQHEAQRIACTEHAVRVLETASPPTYYLPPDDVDWETLIPIEGRSVCEWKGIAQYFALAADTATAVAWSYPDPTQPFESLREFVSFYPGRVACFVDEERVVAQPGGFYGGWITSEVVGPCKGEPGTGGW